MRKQVSCWSRLVLLLAWCLLASAAQAAPLLVADYGSRSIKSVAPDGSVTTYLDLQNVGRPVSVAISPAGQLYLSTSQVRKLEADGTLTYLGGGPQDNARQMAFGPDGLLYAAVEEGIDVETTPGGPLNRYISVPGTLITSGLAFGPAGELYLSHLGQKDWEIDRIGPDGSARTIVGGLPLLGYMAVDPAGNLYTAAAGGSVLRVTPNGSVTTYVSGLSAPFGLAFDDAGALYVSSTDHGTISRITPDGTVSLFASGLNSPEGLAFAPVPEPSALLFVAAPAALAVGRRRRPSCRFTS
jgi:glucose/arabinose dehydrogenase